MSTKVDKRRHRLVPEVLQWCAIDCGPAALKAVLAGFDLDVAYDWLRDACRTQADGTSIDMLEDVGNALGLRAEQVLLPPEHLVVKEADALPAIVAVESGRSIHFVVVWSRHGDRLQIMDPASGRSFVSVDSFLASCYRHEHAMDVRTWRKRAEGREFLAPLTRRMKAAGLSNVSSERLLTHARSDPGHRGLAALDASTRMVGRLLQSGAVELGAESAGVLEALYLEATRTGERAVGSPIPESFYSVLDVADQEVAGDSVMVRGAVALCLSRACLSPETPAAEALERLPGWQAARRNAKLRPESELLRLCVGASGIGFLATCGLALATAVAVGEAVLFRAFSNAGQDLGVVPQRLAVLAALSIYMVVSSAIDAAVTAMFLRVGRYAETQLRMAFLARVARLSDRFFQTRPVSDVAERCHSIVRVRSVAALAQQLLRASFELVLTVVGIAWLDPGSLPWAAAGAVALGLVPAYFSSSIQEHDLRRTVHSASLMRFYLDALVGLVPVRVHGGECALRVEHEGTLVEWVRSARKSSKVSLWLQGVQATVGLGLAIGLVHSYSARTTEPTALLLLLYWTMRMPVLAQTIEGVIRQYSPLRASLVRLLEPLQMAPVDVPWRAPLDASTHSTGVTLDLEGVSVVASGNSLLDDISLRIAPGTHVAVVGRSGAGKSSLAGLLLGWHEPTRGQVLVDGQPLDAERLAPLRNETVWVDPAVALWDEPLLDNLLYGSGDTTSLASALDRAELKPLMQKLPEGLQSPLGEDGRALSGGEGQRVRLGRALCKTAHRLVILDEPFRGTDRSMRQVLLRRARQRWSEATVLFVTHDIRDACSFDRVLVMDNGRVIEDGAPASLLRSERSIFRAMLDNEAVVLDSVWSASEWERVIVQQGRVWPHLVPDRSAGDDDTEKVEMVST